MNLIYLLIKFKRNTKHNDEYLILCYMMFYKKYIFFRFYFYF